MPKKIYIDSNILIAYFAENKSAEPDKKKLVKNTFNAFKGFEVEFYMSNFCITEFVKVMIVGKKEGNKVINTIANNLAQRTIIEGIEIKILDVCPDGQYNFDDFFYDVREKITLYNSGWGDTIHQVIMKNHRIKDILSFDATDFEIIPGIRVISPFLFDIQSKSNKNKI